MLETDFNAYCAALPTGGLFGLMACRECKRKQGEQLER